MSNQKTIIKISRHAAKAVLAKKDKPKRSYHKQKMLKRITPELMLDLIKTAGYTVTIEEET